MEGNQSARIVLHNLEIIERIFFYLIGSKYSLISASLTAKTFSEPAFNVLWYELRSIWPLFRILPTFQRGTNGKYVFTDPIRNEHLQRVLFYAKRIRYLHYKDVKDSPYSNAPRDLLISTFMRMDKLGAFVPLRKVYLHDPLSNAFPLPLTSPNLSAIDIRTLTILPDLTEIGICSSLQSVAQSPLLRSLFIEGPFQGTTLRVLPDFVNLHCLTMSLTSSKIPACFLKRFASSMPSLRRLRIQFINCHFLPNDEPQTISRLFFPSLESLNLTCDSNHLGLLLGILNTPLLKTFSLGVVHFTVNPYLDQFVESNQQVVRNKVHNLAIKATELSLSIVKSFENLRNLTVWTFDRNVSMIDIMGTFTGEGLWSHSLVHLQLVQTKSTNPFDGVSIAALLSIADACPNLESLQISISRSEKPEKKTESQGRKPHDLKKLIFTNLPSAWDDTMSLAIELASFLDLIFPAMAVPQYSGAKADKPGALARREAWWKGVQDMWSMCQTIKDRQQVKQPLSA